MRSRFAQLVVLALCLSFACAAPLLFAGKKDKRPASGTNEQKRAVHALNRLAFGPRSGDVQEVMAMGVDRWIDLQLHPDKIQDSAIESRLASFRTLHMSPKEIVEEFPDNQMVKQVMDGKKSMPSDPARRAIYQVQIARLDEKLAKKEEKGDLQANGLPSKDSRIKDVQNHGQNTDGQNDGRNNNNNNRQNNTDQNPVSSAPVADEPAANDSAKTAEELAAAASASGDAEPAGMPANNFTAAAPGPTDSESKTASTSEIARATSAETKSVPEDPAEARRREDRLYTDLKIQGLVELPADERYKKVMAMSADEKIAFADQLRGGKGQEFLTDLNPKQRETFLAMNNPQGVVAEELAQAKLMRAIYSDRQLEEVMTDFWFNHFNVFAGKGQERLLLTNYEQAVIRPHALGRFEDLLLATAKSPAMLFYLDNWLSVGPGSMQALGIPARPAAYGPYGRPRRFPPNPRPNAKRRQNAGLNENYGRELLELHTLSVNGGYSQRDVTEVAKVFTGWTIEKPADGMGFRFEPRMHEPGPKFVLGHRIKPKGEDEGKEVLHLLATSPQTARFISLKLAQRFVSDDPPPALVDQMAKTFEKKKGDIREVLETLFHSPEFWDDASYRAKMKTPLEFVASALRATGADVQDAMPLSRQLNNMGMPLYGAQPPTGYSMKADTWVSSSALLNRMNFALALTTGKIHGVKVDSPQLAANSPAPSDANTVVTAMEAQIFAAEISKQTHDSIVAQVASPPKAGTPGQGNKTLSLKPVDSTMITGLLLGSPEFQRR